MNQPQHGTPLTKAVNALKVSEKVGLRRDPDRRRSEPLYHVKFASPINAFHENRKALLVRANLHRRNANNRVNRGAGIKEPRPLRSKRPRPSAEAAPKEPKPGTTVKHRITVLRHPDHMILASQDRVAAVLICFHPANLHWKRRDPIRLKAWGFRIPYRGTLNSARNLPKVNLPSKQWKCNAVGEDLQNNGLHSVGLGR